MKILTKNLLLIILLTTSFASFSQIEQAVETTREIEAQATITRGNIDNLILEMNNTNTNIGFNARDYFEQVKVYRQNIERTLIQFEDKMKNDILINTANMIDQFNRIYHSDAFSSSQKTVLLRERMTYINEEIKVIQNKYQSYIKDVYKLTFLDKADMNPSVTVYAKGSATIKFNKAAIDYPASFSYKIGNSRKKYNSQFLFSYHNIWFFNIDGTSYSNAADYTHKAHSEANFREYNKSIKRGFKHAKENNKYTTVYPQILVQSNWDKFPRIMANRQRYIDAQYVTKIFPEIRRGCQTVICLSLRTADTISLLKLINTKIDRNLNFKLADGTRLRIHGVGKDITSSVKILKRDSYPVDLPFDL